MNLASSSFDNMQPRITLDGSGNPLVIWGRMSDESVFFSRWNGSAFTAPVKLNPSWLTVATASWMGPDIAAKGDTIYVVVKRTPEASDTNHIYIISSFNGGLSFSAPVRVDFIADSLSRFPAVTIDETGNPVVAFMKFDAAFGSSRWVVTRSTDYGSTFSPDVKASGWSGPGSVVCDCCPGTILSSGNVSAMLYRDNLSNIRDMWAGLSNNGGSTFTRGFSADTTNWMVMSCPASGPDGVIIGDTIYSVFMSGASGNYRTYLSKSSISNGAVNIVSNLATGIAGLSQQNYPRIAHYGPAAGIVWKQNVSGTAQLPLLFTNDVANGFPAMYDTVDLGDITDADVALGNGKIFVVWQDDNSGTVKYRAGTFTPAVINTAVKEIEENILLLYPNPATSFITLQPGEGFQNGEIKILNVLGETLLKQTISSVGTTQINVSQLKPGAYFITLDAKNGATVSKFIKQ